jgi:hypothetical protein
MYGSKGGESNTHKTQNTAQSRTQVTTWAQNTTLGVLNSNGAQVTISKNQMREVGVLEASNVSWMLGCLLHAPRGPFYSPKAARSRWRPTRKAKVAFCRVVHRIVRCTTGQPLFISSAWSPSYSGAHDRCRFVAVGAPDSPVPLADRWRGPRVARGLRGRPLAHRTVRWIIVVRHQILPRAACSPESSLAHRTLSGAPPDILVCQTEQRFGCTEPSLLVLFFSLFLALRQNMLLLKTMY